MLSPQASDDSDPILLGSSLVPNEVVLTPKIFIEFRYERNAKKKPIIAGIVECWLQRQHQLLISERRLIVPGFVTKLERNCGANLASRYLSHDCVFAETHYRWRNFQALPHSIVPSGLVYFPNNNRRLKSWQVLVVGIHLPNT